MPLPPRALAPLLLLPLLAAAAKAPPKAPPKTAPPAQKPPVAPAQQTGLDLDVLKALADAERANAFGRLYSELGVTVPMEQAGDEMREAQQVWNDRGRLRAGQMTRDAFLKAAAEHNKKRLAGFEKRMGKEKFAKAQELVKRPHDQAELALVLLDIPLREVKLTPADQKARQALGGELQQLFNARAQRDNARRQGKETTQPTAEEVAKVVEEAVKNLMTNVSDDTRKELLRAWPALLPDGPQPPKPADK